MRCSGGRQGLAENWVCGRNGGLSIFRVRFVVPAKGRTCASSSKPRTASGSFATPLRREARWRSGGDSTRVETSTRRRGSSSGCAVSCPRPSSAGTTSWCTASRASTGAPLWALPSTAASLARARGLMGVRENLEGGRGQGERGREEWKGGRGRGAEGVRKRAGEGTRFSARSQVFFDQPRLSWTTSPRNAISGGVTCRTTETGPVAGTRTGKGHERGHSPHCQSKAILTFLKTFRLSF